MTQAEQCKRYGRRCCALSLVRIVLGVIFLMHGGQKVLGWFGGSGLAATVQSFTQQGMSTVLAYLTCFGELLGGIALIVGFLSRVAALGIVIIMVGAVITIHGKNGFFINWFMVPGKGHGYEYNLALISMGLAILIGGGGCLSLDNLFCRKKTIEN